MSLRRPERHQEEPSDAAGFHARGNRYSRNGAYERAIEDYSRAIELDGALAEAYYDRGYSFYEVGRYDEAVADLTRAIELDPEADHYYGQRSLVYLFMDRTDLAQQDQDTAEALRERSQADPK